MDPLQPGPPSMPHLVQVYQHQPPVSDAKMQNPQIIHISHPTLPPSQGKLAYQQTMTSDVHIPVSSMQSDMMGQNQLVMSQNHLHVPQQQMHGQVVQRELNQQLQITSHMLLPAVPVYKQQMLVNEVHQYYGQYDYPKEPCVVTKVDPEREPPSLENKNKECKLETLCQPETTETTEDTTEATAEPLPKEIQPLGKIKKPRSETQNPSVWACNVRKLKHQRGEAYISRRGKFVPERKIKTTKNCLTNCKYRCKDRISDADRELVFRAFYSLNANEKKHFLLNTTERHDIKHSKPHEDHKRKHSFKYFFIIRSERYGVCKNFYLGTLAISQKPVYNVHLSKTETNLPKPDGRGHNEASAHALPNEIKDRVRKHIMSFDTIDSKPIKQFSKKKQYLARKLNIKKMFDLYCAECTKDNVSPVKESMYRKIFKNEFNLHFKKKKEKEKLCCKCKCSLKKK